MNRHSPEEILVTSIQMNTNKISALVVTREMKSKIPNEMMLETY